MKYITVILDGVADYPLDELGGKTPLEYARTPVLDSMAPFSLMGMAKTIPGGMSPGSDTANLSVMGFDPRIYHTGRSPLEAISMGINLSPEDVVFRCNLVTLSGEADYASRTMIDYSAGEIPGSQSGAIIKDLSKELSTKEISFHAGVSYRHVMVWKGGSDDLDLTPPHDILDKKIAGYLPEGPGSEILMDLMVRSSRFLENHPVNIKRIKEGKRPANSIWFWGQGRKPALDSFYEKYGQEGAVISAVDLIRGIGISAGLEVVQVENITGTIDSNFRGKAEAAV
ncbi:MAG: phosphoglycerate mutase, partial [Actinobacteria bacterium]|nr:phosphoglycerate mutase [Actinomycetota bacterium]